MGYAVIPDVLTELIYQLGHFSGYPHKGILNEVHKTTNYCFIPISGKQ